MMLCVEPDCVGADDPDCAEEGGEEYPERGESPCVIFFEFAADMGIVEGVEDIDRVGSWVVGVVVECGGCPVDGDIGGVARNVSGHGVVDGRDGSDVDSGEEDPDHGSFDSPPLDATEGFHDADFGCEVEGVEDERGEEVDRHGGHLHHAHGNVHQYTVKDEANEGLCCSSNYHVPSHVDGFCLPKGKAAIYRGWCKYVENTGWAVERT